MIQSAYEMMHLWQQMPPAGAAMLQVSFNILNRPHDAVRDLLGIPLPGISDGISAGMSDD